MKTTTPWGYSEVLAEGDGWAVKRLLILDGRRISLQRHSGRDEFWTFVRGRGQVRLDDHFFRVEAGSSTIVVQDTAHRITAGPGCDLELIEVWLGHHLAEDDIVRMEDDYGRA